MKKAFLFIAVFILIFSVGMAQAAYLEWTHDGVNTDGFIVYFADAINAYNYNVIGGDQRTCELSLLNLYPDVSYTFYITAYSEAGESGPSNTVTHTGQAFEPPPDVLPTPVSLPSVPGDLIIQEL